MVELDFYLQPFSSWWLPSLEHARLLLRVCQSVTCDLLPPPSDQFFYSTKYQVGTQPKMFSFYKHTGFLSSLSDAIVLNVHSP